MAALRVFPGLDPAWSRRLAVTDAAGVRHTWHILDNAVQDPVGTILCVHGNPTWSYLWRGMLAAAPPGWRVVAPDQLGMGYSERLTQPRVLAQRVADLGDLTEALGITGPVVTLGHDWGGSISLGWALSHRDQLSGVVLANTAVSQPDYRTAPALIRLAHARVLRAMVCVRTPTFVHAATALSRPPLPVDVRRAFAGPYASRRRRRSVGDFVEDIPLERTHPSRPDLDAIAAGTRSIEKPVLLLWGPRDPVFGEQHLADLRERLPRAQLHRFEGASHLVTEDAPQYADAVARWVGELGTASGPAGPGRTGSVAAAPAAARTGTAGRADQSLFAALTARADDGAAAVVEVGGASLSWASLARRTGELASGLARAGLRPGDRVALLVPPSADLTTAVYAVWRAGGVVVVADRGLGFTGMRRALRSAAVDHVVGGGLGLAAARLMGIPGSRIAVGRVRRPLRRVLGVAHHVGDLARLGAGTSPPPEPPLGQDCAVVFTSGATGPAKGVVYRHRQVLAQIESLRAAYRIVPEDRMVAAFAPFALLGPALGIASAAPDVDVTRPATLTAAGLAEAVGAVHATIVFASPAALRGVAATAGDLPAGHRDALGQVRLLISAGAPVPASLLRSVRTVLPNAEAHTPYGMTEALPVTDVSLAQIEEAGAGEGVCVGRPLASVEVAVRPLAGSGTADEAGPHDGTGRTGEICVRGAHVKDRYDALWWTEQTTSPDGGWHRTGDVGHLDAEGRLWVEGRLSHVVSTASGAVTPVGTEQRVEALEEVQAAAVVGVGPEGTQVVVVVVVPADAAAPGGLPSLRRRLAHRAPARWPRATTTLRLAEPGLAEAARGAARVEVAAVLVTARLPVDIRHASKVDRQDLSRRATRLLAGTADRRARRSGTR